MSVIQTIKQNCRRCYSCVRECPAKAIRIVDGQASVVASRCIACGRCTVVCSQKAKAYQSGIAGVLELLEGSQKIAALVAPSFPADTLFSQEVALPKDMPERFLGALRQLGFHYVIEVASGADLVSAAYREYLTEHQKGVRIATTCPAVIEYICKYNPDLVPSLIPVVSPMIATAQIVKAQYGDDVACVFIGPCIAKKQEARDPLLSPCVDEVLTFHELHTLLRQTAIDVAKSQPSYFDPPTAGLGLAYPMVGGLLTSAGLDHSLFNPEIIVLSGPNETTEVLNSLKPSSEEPLFVEAMMCRGCYSGPGIEGEDKRILRKRRMTDYIRRRLVNTQGVVDTEVTTTHRAESKAKTLWLSRRFTPDDQRLKDPTEDELRVILANTNKFTRADELNCGACGYPTCRAKATAVARGLAEEAMCLPFMIDQAERVCHELKVPWTELREIHRHLINTEKLASMGQMAAGVAHELNNPLGTILLYSTLLERKLKDRDELQHDLQLLVAEAERCKKIIGMMLDFARQNRVQLERTNIASLLVRAVDESRFAAELAGSTIHIEWLCPKDLDADIDRDQLGQVLVNLIKNGIESMEGINGTVVVKADLVPTDNTRLRLSVTDQGKGIPQDAQDKIFQPFFTTKSLGKGTGLGLPIAYGIVKMHQGTILCDSRLGVGTTFTIELPRHQKIFRKDTVA